MYSQMFIWRFDGDQVSALILTMLTSVRVGVRHQNEFVTREHSGRRGNEAFGTILADGALQAVDCAG